MANCYEFYHKDADLTFPTGLVEVVSRAESSKAALSCSGFFNLLTSENSIFAFFGKYTVLRRTLINSLSKENRTYGVQVVHLSPDPRSSDISLFSHSPLHAEIRVNRLNSGSKEKKKKALSSLKTLDCSYSNKLPPFLVSLMLPFLPSIS